MTLAKFDELVAKKRELELWWAILNKSDFTGNRFKLRVDFPSPAMVAICGQEYAGAKNYHDGPKWFASYIVEQTRLRTMEITKAAVDAAIAELNAKIAHCRQSIIKALDEAEHGESQATGG